MQIRASSLQQESSGLQLLLLTPGTPDSTAKSAVGTCAFRTTRACLARTWASHRCELRRGTPEDGARRRVQHRFNIVTAGLVYCCEPAGSWAFAMILLLLLGRFRNLAFHVGWSYIHSRYLGCEGRRVLLFVLHSQNQCDGSHGKMLIRHSHSFSFHLATPSCFPLLPLHSQHLAVVDEDTFVAFGPLCTWTMHSEIWSLEQGPTHI
jgi:hypothetical protein